MIKPRKENRMALSQAQIAAFSAELNETLMLNWSHVQGNPNLNLNLVPWAARATLGPDYELFNEQDEERHVLNALVPKALHALTLFQFSTLGSLNH